MAQRINNKTPLQIINLFTMPYVYFTDMLASKDLTLMDIGSGEALSRGYLNHKWKYVTYFDKEYHDEAVAVGDITNIPKDDKSVDVTFCFETIEHVNHLNQNLALKELERVTKSLIVIGSIDKFGLDYVNGVEIFKAKNGTNPYHINELDVLSFPELIESRFDVVDYYHSNANMTIVEGLQSRPKGFCNYVIIGVS